MKSFVHGLLGALTVLIVAAIIIPQYSDYTDRGISTVIIHFIKPEQAKIETSLLSETLVEDKVLLNSHKFIQYLKIQKNGTIIV